MDPYLTLGIIGMALILLAFLLNQLGTWNQKDLPYDFTNALGSLLLIIYAYDGGAWPFVVLNTVWFAYSAWDVGKGLSKSTSS